MGRAGCANSGARGGVSQATGEYSTKKRLYGEMGVLYYVVYNPLRRRKSHLEVYRLVDGVYQLESGNPVWLAEIGLGIGAQRGMYQGIMREWLYWYDEQGQRFLTPEEQIYHERQRIAQQERQRAKLLEERLRALGVDPESL